MIGIGSYLYLKGLKIPDKQGDICHGMIISLAADTKIVNLGKALFNTESGGLGQVVEILLLVFNIDITVLFLKIL